MAAYHFHLLVSQAILILTTSQWVTGAHPPPNYPATFPPPKVMNVLYQWRYIDYTWKSDADREYAIKNGTYIPENCIPLGLQVYKGRFFVTTPRHKEGVPAVISTVSNHRRHGQYLLEPFPNFDFNREGNCHGFTNIYQPAIDDVGRLWAVDAGIVDVIPTLKPKRLCKPKIVLFDLTARDKILGTFYVPEKLLFCNSLLNFITVDIRYGQANDAWAYIADVLANQMLVFSLRSGKFHSVQNPVTFFPVPEYFTFVVNGTTVTETDGLVGFALGPVEKRADGSTDRRVYYHPFSSLKEYFVMASTIQDAAAYNANPMAYPKSFYPFPTERKARAVFEVLDLKTGIMFFNLPAENAIYCWNTITDYYMSNTAIVAQNETTMQYILGTDLFEENIYVVSTRLQRFFQLHNLIDITEVNFRILEDSVANLTKGTPCEVKYAPNCQGDAVNLDHCREIMDHHKEWK